MSGALNLHLAMLLLLTYNLLRTMALNRFAQTLGDFVQVLVANILGTDPSVNLK